MSPAQGHVPSVESVRVDFERSHHLDRSDHEPDLAAISEEGDPYQQHLPRHMSFDSSDSSFNSISDIIDGLPTAVKAGLGPLRTIQRSASIRSWVSYFYERSTSSMGAQMAREEHRQEHRRTLVSTTTTEVEMQEQHQEQHQQPMNSNQKRRRTSTTTPMRSPKEHPPSSELAEYVEPERKGIDRFCGMQGQLLVSHALTERHSSFNNQAVRADGGGGGGEHSNERRAYVQGIAWLLQGLPQDLDEIERADLRRAIPPQLVGGETDQHRIGGGGPNIRRLCAPSQLPGGRGDDTGADGRSFIRRVIAALIVQIFVPMQWLWACFVAMLARAVYLERKYQVAELVLKHSGELGYTMGRSGVRLSGMIYNHGGARVGAVLTDAVSYVAEGVFKGVSDGLREACLALKEREMVDLDQ